METSKRTLSFFPEYFTILQILKPISSFLKNLILSLCVTLFALHSLQTYKSKYTVYYDQ